MSHGFGNAEVCAAKTKAGAEAKASRQNDTGCRLNTPGEQFKLGHARSPMSHGLGNADVSATKATAGAEANAIGTRPPAFALRTPKPPGALSRHIFWTL